MRVWRNWHTQWPEKPRPQGLTGSSPVTRTRQWPDCKAAAGPTNLLGAARYRGWLPTTGDAQGCRQSLQDRRDRSVTDILHQFHSLAERRGAKLQPSPARLDSVVSVHAFEAHEDVHTLGKGEAAGSTPARGTNNALASCLRTQTSAHRGVGRVNGRGRQTIPP